ncbi:MAG: BLUF domain-containing protein [Aquabacterium sp.]|nr:BLUF domain-containing protein [Aquabacterium sp.]
MFERLVYVSRAAPGITARDCYDIIRVAHNRNSQFGLTGALLFLDGYFIQVLEGDCFRMRERFQVIAADRRHTDVDLRQTVLCEELLFTGEWMALRSDAEVDPAVKARFGYRPGLPADAFSGEQIVAFVQACCQQHATAA